MEVSEILILLIILFLAIPFGYFLHKAISNVAMQNLIETLEQQKLINSQQSTLIAQLKDEINSKSSELERLQSEFFQLTMVSKQLSEKEVDLQRQLLEKQYEVPPDYIHLQESNALLAKQMQKSREKVKKWKAKDFIKENKKLLKEVKKAKKRVLQLKKQNDTFKVSHDILNKVRAITNEAPSKVIAKEVLPKKEEKNIFLHQPKFKKEQVFNELFRPEKEAAIPPVIELEEEEKTLIDLVGMDEKALKTLNSKGIHSFEELVQMKIKELAKIFGDHSEKYPYETWPIQSRLALRGEWELIEEYKSKD